MKKILIIPFISISMLCGISATGYPNYAKISLVDSCGGLNYKGLNDDGVLNHAYLVIQNLAPYSFSFIGQTINPGYFSCFSIINNEPVVNRDILYYNQHTYLNFTLKNAASIVVNDYKFEEFSSEIMCNIITNKYKDSDSVNNPTFLKNMFNLCLQPKIEFPGFARVNNYLLSSAIELSCYKDTNFTLPTSMYNTTAKVYRNGTWKNL